MCTWEEQKSTTQLALIMLPFRTPKSVEDLGTIFDQILNISGASKGEISQKKKATCSVLLIQASKESMEAQIETLQFMLDQGADINHKDNVRIRISNRFDKLQTYATS